MYIKIVENLEFGEVSFKLIKMKLSSAGTPRNVKILDGEVYSNNQRLLVLIIVAKPSILDVSLGPGYDSTRKQDLSRMQMVSWKCY